MPTSPLNQFEVYDIFSLAAPLFHLGIYLTNFGLYVIMTLITLIALFTSVNISVVPTRWSLGLESLYASLQGMVADQIGDAQTQYVPFIITIFMFIFSV